ncbi:MAG: HAMP domain-containing protein, partial [Clostridiales bacterium]|nr:HAMP domain-containing protein [Clostridiales bacterium]
MRQKSSSLTVKLIPPMLLMLALIMAVICIIIFSVIRAEFHENLNRELKIKVDSNAGNMNVAIESMMQLIDNFCYDLESNTDMSFDTVKRALDAKLTTLPRESIPAFYVAIGGRNVLYETMGWIPAADFVVKERPWYINAAGNQTPQIISYADANTGIYAICASRGVTLNTGEQAVVALDMEISSWLDQNIVPGEAEYSFVTDSQGMIIFHRNPEFVPHAQSESYLTSAWPDYAHLEALGPDEIVEITDFDNVKYLFRSSPVKSGNFRIFTGIQSSQASKRINSLLIWLVPMMIGLIFLLGILSLVFIRRIILCPLQKLAAVSDRIAAGDIEAGFQHNAHDEIGVLSQNFGQVRDSIKGLIESVNHMSHEQSKGDLDARMDEKYFNGAYRNVASSVNAMVSGIVFMVDKTQDCLENFSNGDFSVDFPVLPGKQMRLTQSINQLQNNLKEIKYEISRLADNASQGNLSIRADMDGFSGDWAEALRGLNALLEAVAVPIAEASAAIGSIAQGSLNITIAG